MAFSSDTNKLFKFDAQEAEFDLASPLRAFYSPDYIQQFGRRDMSRWMVDGKYANRCQKSVAMMRCGPLR